MRRRAPDWDDAVAYWQTLATDEGAVFDAEVFLDADTLEPFVTWGTNPGQGVSLCDAVPDPADYRRPATSAPPPSAPSSTWTSRPARR